MNLEAVLKVGGSLSRGKGLETLCREIGRLGERHRLLVVPGGGDFAERVREADRRFHLDETAAHCMALLAMDQYGYILNQLIGGSWLTADLASACDATESGKVGILLPSAIIVRENPLPHSWRVTSDSIAAWVSLRTSSDRLVLLKDVDGLFTADGLIQEMMEEQLTQHAGGVDPYLSEFLVSAAMETWVINGLMPGRLAELLETGGTIGTRIGRVKTGMSVRL